MSEKKKNEKLDVFVLAEDWFKENKISFSGRRATVVAIYYSFPSNINASGGSGSNVISQKIIPWGNESEPRIYISPYSMKRRIRDYWIKKGEKVGFGETVSRVIDLDKDESPIDYIDYDLFGYMSAKGKEVAKTRPAPITSWGAVSLEALHSFIDFNTSVKSVTGSDKGGSIFNRGISKEFYFTSFFINPDLVSVDVANVEKSKTELREYRLKLFFEGLKYAMQKDVGGPRDKPACVFLAVAIGDYGYPNLDKKLFKNIVVKDDVIYIDNLPEDCKLLFFDDTFVKINGNNKTLEVEDIINELYNKRSD